MLANAGDKFRLSCVAVTATFAILFIATRFVLLGWQFIVGTLITTWLLSSIWTLKAYGAQSAQKPWHHALRFIWLAFCVYLSITFAGYIAGLVTGKGFWVLY